MVVATVAFGMGINNPHVRHVVHYKVPQTVDTYYQARRVIMADLGRSRLMSANLGHISQELGRCGRDGQLAQATLVCNSKDLVRPCCCCWWWWWW